MALPTMAQLRAAIAANLDAIPNVQASAYILGQPTYPSVWVVPGDTAYDTVMHRGGDCVKLRIRAAVGLVADQAAQKLLDTMLAPTGASSVKAAVEADKSLGGLVGDQATHVTGHRGYQIIEQPQVGTGMSTGQILAAEWDVEVYT